MTPDRRTFTLAALTAAGAGYFGAQEALRAQAPTAPAAAGQPVSPSAPPPPPPWPLGNGEPPASQFQPYPGGTGALLDRLVRERGVAAFARSPLMPHGWTGAVPATDDDVAFLPAHRLAALLRGRKITSTRLTEVYLARLKRLNPTLNCVVTLLEATALAEAARADAEIGGRQVSWPAARPAVRSQGPVLDERRADDLGRPRLQGPGHRRGCRDRGPVA